MTSSLPVGKIFWLEHWHASSNTLNYCIKGCISQHIRLAVVLKGCISQYIRLCIEGMHLSIPVDFCIVGMHLLIHWTTVLKGWIS